MTNAKEFRNSGAALISGALSAADRLIAEMAFANAAGQRQSSICPDVIQRLMAHRGLRSLSEDMQGKPCRLVRVIAFDKTPDANWFVTWHQDRTIAVAAHSDVAGYSRWTFKDAMHHVEPPVAILEDMVTLRLHIDECGPQNGPLEIIPGSHKSGRLEKAEIARLAVVNDARICVAQAADILAMRPLLLHRSRKAVTASRRRVLHLEFASSELPKPLEWALKSKAATLT